jgi:hypothetical protein
MPDGIRRSVQHGLPGGQRGATEQFRNRIPVPGSDRQTCVCLQGHFYPIDEISTGIDGTPDRLRQGPGELHGAIGYRIGLLFFST